MPPTYSIVRGAGKDTSFDLIAETELAATASTIDFTSIPSTYRNLRVVCVGRLTALTTISVRLNGDSTAQYDDQRLLSTGTSVTGNESLGATAFRAGGWNISAGQMLTIEIPNYTDASIEQPVHILSSRKDGTATGNLRLDQFAGFWRGTAAITQVSIIGGTFAVGTVATLYGLKGA